MKTHTLAHRDENILFYDEWKRRIDQSKTIIRWIITIGICILAAITGLLFGYFITQDKLFLWVILVVFIFTLSTSIFVLLQDKRYTSFMINYRRLIYALEDNIDHTMYQEIFWEYQAFIGITPSMKVEDIVHELRILPDSDLYSGETKRGLIKTIEYQDTLEDFAKKITSLMERLQKKQ